jgi:hypothetical protein
MSGIFSGTAAVSGPSQFRVSSLLDIARPYRLQKLGHVASDILTHISILRSLSEAASSGEIGSVTLAERVTDLSLLVAQAEVLLDPALSLCSVNEAGAEAPDNLGAIGSSASRAAAVIGKAVRDTANGDAPGLAERVTHLSLPDLHALLIRVVQESEQGPHVGNGKGLGDGGDRELKDDHPTPTHGYRRLFRLEGAIWRVEFDQEHGLIPDSAGMLYLSLLLSRPNRPVPVLELGPTEN